MSNNAAYFSALPHIKEIRLDDTEDGSNATFQVLGGGTNVPLKVTAVWTDPEGPQRPASPAHDDPTPALVNDIDLRVYGPVGEGGAFPTNYPWILDPQNPTNAATRGDNARDNVEQVLIENPGCEWYTVSVSYKGMLTNGYQDVSVIVSGNVQVDGPDFAITEFGACSSNGLVELTWPGVVGAAYEVLDIGDLLATNETWTAAGAMQPNHEGDVLWTNALPAASNAFYRLRRLR